MLSILQHMEAATEDTAALAAIHTRITAITTTTPLFPEAITQILSARTMVSVPIIQEAAPVFSTKAGKN